MTQEHQTSAGANDSGLAAGCETAGEAVDILADDVRPTPLPDPFQFNPCLAKLAKKSALP